MKTTVNWLLLTILFIVLSIPGSAQFVLKINASNTQDSIAYLRTNLFDEKNYIPKDTIKLYKSPITIKNTKSIVGGMYYLYFPKSKQKIQFILEDQDSVRLTISGNDYLQSATINLNKNTSLLGYQRLEKALSHYDSSYTLALKSGKKFNQIQKAAYFKVKTDSLVAYRTTALKRFKKQDAIHIYFSTLNALDNTIPNKRDYVGRQNFLKQFELNEPKLFFTPVMRQIIVEYLSYYPLDSDSLVQGLDAVFGSILCTNKAYSFVFDYFTKVFKNREVQNNTEGYAYLINKYVKNNTCAFLDKKVKDALIAELNQIQSQQLNDTALNLILEDTSGIKSSLLNIAKQFNYTVLIFFDPNCEHCKVELPKMDSTIKVLERELLIKIGKYAVCNEPNIDKDFWKEFILSNKLDYQYTHVIMSSNNENLELRKAYDAFTNPLFYLLDKDGILIAKKLSTNTLRKILIQSFRNFKN